MTMKLFCWVIDKSENPFSVDVANGETVEDLKKAIIKILPHTLAGLDVDQLSLWKVGDFSTSSILCLTYPTQGFHQDNKRSQE